MFSFYKELTNNPETNK